MKTIGYHQRYTMPARMLHWIIAALVIAALVLIESRGYAPRGSALRRALREWHQQAALAAFLLLWLRIAVRLRHRPPPIVPALPSWQQHGGEILHAVFYILLLILPVLGVVMVQTDDRTVSLLGAHLPQWLSPDKDLTDTLEDVHAFLGDVMIGAIALHVAAALWHHFVRGDNTLQRMV